MHFIWCDHDSIKIFHSLHTTRFKAIYFESPNANASTNRNVFSLFLNKSILGQDLKGTREKNWREKGKIKVKKEERKVLVEIWSAFKSSSEKNWTE